MTQFVNDYTRPRSQDRRPTWEPRPYSQNQANLISKMMRERGITREALVSVFPDRPATFADGGKVIDWLKGHDLADEPASPSAPAQAKALPERKDKNGKSMPQYYAVEMDGKPHFFRIKPGRKAGFYFVDEQASDDLYSVQGARRERVLALVLADPAKAQAMYGELIGRCARCHSTLTDHSNPYFSMGLGPECGQK